MEDLQAALKRYWGYDTFRPMQERIIVLNDASLDDLCRKQPAQLRQLTSVIGIVERK